jgi:DUF1009 family protein
MAGQVKHVKLFGGVMPDLTLLSVLTKLKAKNTDSLIAAVAEVLQDHGITLMNSTSLLHELVAGAGRVERHGSHGCNATRFHVRLPHCGCHRRRGRWPDGRRQRPRGGRGGRYGGHGRPRFAARGSWPESGTRVVKVAKPQQDMRFDVPVVGVATVTAMVEAGADAITIDAGRTLILDGDEFIRAADGAGLVVIGRNRS